MHSFIRPSYPGISVISSARSPFIRCHPGHRDLTFHRADQQALTSLISFNLGASIGCFGDKVGAITRLWLPAMSHSRVIAPTFLQALFTMAASIAIWKSGQPDVAVSRADPAWTNLLSFVGVAFMSASLGLQGIMGKRLNTPFSTTSACHNPLSWCFLQLISHSIVCLLTSIW
jgi:hypothetical protein